MVWLRLICWMWSRGTVGGAVLGVLFGTFLVPIIGTIIGLFFGILLGAITGIVNGMALAVMTRMWFLPPQDSFNYRRSATILVVICTAVTGLLLLRMWGNAIVFIIPPTVIAAFAAGYFAWRFPRYVVTQLPSRNPPVNVLS